VVEERTWGKCTEKNGGRSVGLEVDLSGESKRAGKSYREGRSAEAEKTLRWKK